MTDPESSHLPAPPWQRHPPERTRRRGREPITREAIVETALRLLDKDGLDELSMRRLADELDTGPASLYWHVGSKAGLLDLLFDRVIGEVVVPEPEPERWQEQLKEVRHAGRAMILRHRDIVRISIGRIPMERTRFVSPRASSPSSAPEVSRTSSRSQRITCSSRSSTASPSTRRRTSPPRSRVRRMSRRQPQRATTSPGYLFEQFPNLIAVARHFGYADNDQSFELLIDLFVDGLAQRVGAQAQRPARRSKR